MWKPLCMHVQSDGDNNDQVGLGALCLLLVFPQSLHIVFIFYFIIF